MMKHLLPLLISFNQCAFVPGKKQCDNVLIAQEVVSSFARKKGHSNCWMIIKLDLEKTYDKISWEIICNILSNFQFTPKWVNLVRHCISTLQHSIIFNGSLSEFFSPKRDICQGDLLSPYLFILCMEILTSLINKKVNTKRWTMVKFKDISISHLLYADDVLLFAKINQKSVKSIDEVLKTFMSMSGLNISSSKSSIWFSPNTPNHRKSFACSTLGIKEIHNPSSYLGIPLGIFVKKKDFDCIIDKIRSRVNSWNAKYLSQARKMVLIKSVCSAILAFYMQSLPLPKSVCLALDKYIRDFF